MKNNKILVHCCCAICAGYPLEKLSLDFEPVAYFYNPNLYPAQEYEKRLDAMQTLCDYNKVDLIKGDYKIEEYDDYMQDFAKMREGSARCPKCFEFRLEKTCQKAKELGINQFTTTLSVSPHKNFNTIKQIGDRLAKKYNLTFVDYNFKKKDGFLKTTRIAKTLNLYRQNYCGCKNSLPES